HTSTHTDPSQRRTHHISHTTYHTPRIHRDGGRGGQTHMHPTHTTPHITHTTYHNTHNTHHVSHTTYHTPHITHHISHTTYHTPHITHHVSHTTYTQRRGERRTDTPAHNV